MVFMCIILIFVMLEDWDYENGIFYHTADNKNVYFTRKVISFRNYEKKKKNLMEL